MTTTNTPLTPLSPLTLVPFTRADLTLVIDALGTAAARHESQAHAVKFGRDHDDIAFRMRVLRVHLILARTKINGHHPTKPAKEPLA